MKTKKNKIKMVIFIVLMFLPIAAALAAIPFMPETIPVHFDLNGNPDRMGSRWETLLITGMSVIMGIAVLISMKATAKKDTSGNNSNKAFLTVGISVLTVFNIITAYFLMITLGIQKNTFTIQSMIKVTMGLIGIMLIVTGNILPTIRRNAFIGFRTPSTMQNDEVWKKSQRFAGIMSIIAGVLMTAAALITNENVCLIICMGIILIFSLVMAIYSFKIPITENKKSE